MAKELEHFDDPAVTIYAKPLPLVAAGWAADAVALAEDGTRAGYYTADVALGGAADAYAVFLQAGGAPADTDAERGVVDLRAAKLLVIAASTAIDAAAAKLSAQAADTVTAKLDTSLELDGAVYRFTTNALELAPGGTATTIDGVPLMSLYEILLAWFAGEWGVEEPGDATKIYTFFKQDGVTPKLAVTFNAAGAHTATEIDPAP